MKRAPNSDVLTVLVIIGIVVGIIGWGLPITAKIPVQISLGVWQTPQITSCEVTAGQFSQNVSSQTCELMGNVTHRGIFAPQSGIALSGYSAYLNVGCISVTGNGGLILLQYALYNIASEINTTNWQNIGTFLYIDGVNNPCPAQIMGSDTVLNSTASSIGYIFRVVGGNGSLGDSMRFGNVRVIMELKSTRIFNSGSAIQSTTSTTISVSTNIPTTVSQSVTVRWIATNASSTNPSCGSSIVTGNVNVCWQRGTASCTIAIAGTSCAVSVTYPTAFTGTVQTVSNPSTAAQAVTLIIGTITLLSVQTVTV